MQIFLIPQYISFVEQLVKKYSVRFEVFMVMTMKSAIFWDLAPRGSYKNLVSEEHIASIIRMTRIGKLGTFAVTND
jgi:hypothetical protein